MTYILLWAASFLLSSLSPISSPANKMLTAIGKQHVAIRILFAVFFPVILAATPLLAILMGDKE